MRVVTLELGGRSVQVGVPERRSERMRGFRDRAARELDGLLFLRTRSIHTVGMDRAIVVVLLDRDLRVLDVLELPPGKIVLPRPRVRHVLELLERVELNRGERVGGYTVAAASGRGGTGAREA